MAINLRAVYGSLVDGAGADYYTCPTGAQAWVKTIAIVNNDVAPHTLSLWAGSPTVGAQISAVDLPLAAGAAYFDTNGYALLPGDSLSGSCDANSVVSFAVSILEKT